MNYYYADGTTTDFLIPYNYRTKDFYIRVKINNASPTPYTLVGTESGGKMSGAKIQFATAPPKGSVVQIFKVPVSYIVNAIPSDLTVITADGTEKANYAGQWFMLLILREK